MIERIKELISQRARISLEEITDESRILGDLGVDSMELVNLVVEIEEMFGVTISDRELWQFQTFGDVREYVEKNIK